VVFFTRQQSRRQTALRLGATHAFDPAASDTIASVREVTKGGADVVIECAGVSDTLQSGLKMARRGGS
ncbi:zinc-binding dehydrogenase, partial [Rhizobium johnstonii]